MLEMLFELARVAMALCQEDNPAKPVTATPESSIIGTDIVHPPWVKFSSDANATRRCTTGTIIAIWYRLLRKPSTKMTWAPAVFIVNCQ